MKIIPIRHIKFKMINFASINKSIMANKLTSTNLEQFLRHTFVSIQYDSKFQFTFDLINQLRSSLCFYSTRSEVPTRDFDFSLDLKLCTLNSAFWLTCHISLYCTTRPNCTFCYMQAESATEYISIYREPVSRFF